MTTRPGVLLLSLVLAGCAAKQVPAEAEAPQPKVSEEVSFEAAGMTVHGTLTRPGGGGRHPAVLLIAGSGPTDRDWNSTLIPGTNGSGALLALALADLGVVVLRYDKRGTGKTGVPKEVTWEDYLAEQQAALALLRGHPSVDPSALTIAGHSEGGVHALRLAQAEGTAVDKVALLSTPGRPLRALIVEQVGGQLRAAKFPDAEPTLERLDRALGEISSGKQVDVEQVSPIRGLQGLVQAFQAEEARRFAAELLTFDPAAALAKLPHRALVLSGEKDLQVSPERDARLLAAARPEGTRLLLISDADHVLKREALPMEQLDATVGLRYNAEERELAEGVVEALAAFARGR